MVISLVELNQQKEKSKAKKHYKDNISKISDLDDICTVIDELIERANDVNLENKEKFSKELIDWKNDIIAEMRFCEEENLEYEEKWEEDIND